MMLPQTILALELSTARGSVALASHREILFSADFVSHRSHNSMLYGPIREALTHCGRRPDAIIVGTGPGSYTGVRIAIAAAQGIGLAAGSRIVGCPSLCAAPASTTTYHLVGDARRGGWYHAQINETRLVGDITILTEAEIAAQMDAGQHESWLTFDENLLIAGTAVQPICPTAQRLAEIVSRWTEEEWNQHDSAGPLQPIYLREAFITTPKRSHLVVQEPMP